MILVCVFCFTTDQTSYSVFEELSLKPRCRSQRERSVLVKRGPTMKTEDQLLDRITVRSDVFGGIPIIRDMRIAVEHVLAMLAAGDSIDVILQEYPDLNEDDIRACLIFANRSIAGEKIHGRLHVREGS